MTTGDKQAFPIPCQKCGKWRCEHKEQAVAPQEQAVEVLDGIHQYIKGYFDQLLVSLDDKITLQAKDVFSDCEKNRSPSIKDVVDLCIAELGINIKFESLEQQISSVSESIPNEDKLKLVAATCFAGLIQNYCTENKINSKIQSAIDLAGILNEEAVGSIAKSKFGECFEALDLEQLVTNILNDTDFDEKFKAIAFDCLKQLIDSLPGNNPGPDADTKVTNNQLTCNATGMVTSTVTTDDGVFEAKEDFSKFLGAASNIATDLSIECDDFGNLKIGLEQSAANVLSATVNASKFFDNVPLTFGVCFEHGGPTAYIRENKVTLVDHLKCERWDGGFEHVAYDQAVGCRVMKYKGPTQGDIEQIASDIFDQNTGGTVGLNASQVNTLIQEAGDTLCINGFSSSYDAETGALTLTVSDQCGSKSTTEIIAAGSTGGNGITAAQAKIIAEECINQLVGAIVLQIINENVDVPTTADIQTIIQNWVTVNQVQFCNISTGLNFDPVTRALTSTVTDQCGPKTASVIIPDITGISESEAASIAKTQALICLDNAEIAGRFCNTGLQTTLNPVTGIVQTTVTDVCGSQSDTYDLGAYIAGLGISGDPYCLQSAQFAFEGNTLSLVIEQENCPTDILASVVLPFDTNGNLIECCNTTATFGFNGQTCVGTLTMNQSAGDPVAVNIPFADIFTAITVTENGVKSQSLLMGQKTLMEVPVATLAPQVVRSFLDATEVQLECLSDCQYFYRCDQDTFYWHVNGAQVALTAAQEPPIAIITGYQSAREFACKWEEAGRVYCGNYTETYKHDENVAKLCVCAEAGAAESTVTMTLPSGDDYEIDWGDGDGYELAQSGVQQTHPYALDDTGALWCGTIKVRLPLCEDNANIATVLSGLVASPSFCSC